MQAALGCSFYDDHITPALVTEVAAIQGGIPFSAKFSKDVEEILRLSPSALAISIHPQNILVRHRTEQPAMVDERTNDFDRKTLMLMICDGLIRDYGEGPMMRYFLEVRGIRELETTQKLILKSDHGRVLARTVTKRVQNRYAAEEAGGKLWQAIIFGDVPQPWEPQLIPSTLEVDS
jgi:hypothetical protein